jgi:phosphoglycerol transferase MdoB-like AlkP superfamily enzyme
VFTLQRILFSLNYLDLVFQDGIITYLQLYVYSLRLDLSTIGYISMLTLPFWLFYQLALGKTKVVAWNILKIQQILILLIISLIHSGEINVYSEWMHKLTVRVFNHLIHPDEVFRSATIGNYVFFFLYLAIELCFGLWLLKRLFTYKENSFSSYWKHSAIHVSLFPLIGGLAFLSARGGWQQIPIGINSAMYSSSTILNDVSVNSTYFFLYSLHLYGKVDLDNYLAQTSHEDATDFTEKMNHFTSSSETLFLKNKRPNIVFVVLESWAADALSYSGLYENSTPNFDKLISEGVYFSQLYAAAGTSEIGNAALFGGYPALPQVSLTMHPEKSRKLKSLNQTLKEEGNYFTSYLFGGDLKYGNIGGYFLDHQFDVVMDENDFENIGKRGLLNVYDHDLFDKFLGHINTSPQPFMQIAFTGSTHSPYDIPKEWEGFWNGNESGIMNSIRYADHSLFTFLESCKKQPWFNETLFIFVADHGRTTPLNSNAIAASFFRIPLLFWGPTIEESFRGVDYEKVAMQSDLVATLLHQMNISSSDYPWSRDILSSDFQEFAVYSSSQGYGWKDKAGDFFWHMSADQFSINTFPLEQQDEKLHNARKYLKALWEEFKGL